MGYYDDGDGKKLGNKIEFRTTLEFSYELVNKNRIGISFGHISKGGYEVFASTHEGLCDKSKCENRSAFYRKTRAVQGFEV